MGEVWRGVHRKSGVAVAMKVLTRDGARKPLYVKSFHNEVAAICRLHHPGIVEVFDYGVISAAASISSQGRLVEGSPYLIMELAEFGSLDHYKEQLRWPELKAILLSVLDALAHAHAQGLVHRDLKPQNILIGCGEQRGVKLTDFGLAHAMTLEYEKPVIQDAGEETSLQGGWGTPAYMAPEQFRGSWRDYGPWTDLYALGCMTFELAMGAVPFLAEEHWEFGRLHMLEEVPRLLSPTFEVPDELEAWVLRLLQKLPTDRFQRAADAALALISMQDDALLLEEHESKARRQLVESDASRQTFFSAQVTNKLDELEEALFPEPGKAVAYVTRMVSKEKLSAKLIEDRIASARPTPRHTMRHARPAMHIEDAPRPVRQASAPHITPGTKRERDALIDSGSLEPGYVPSQVPSKPLEPMRINLPPMPLSWRKREDRAQRKRRALHGAGRGLYELHQPDLIGREVERDLLWQALREVHLQGQPRAVMLRGVSGVGKSMIAGWLGVRAHELGVAEVMRAIHSPRRSSFDGLSAMLSRYLRLHGCDAGERLTRLKDHIDAKWCVDYELCEAIELFISPQPQPPKERLSSSVLGGQPARQRLHTLRAFLEYETRDRPLVVILEDVQWGPEALIMVQNVLTRRTALSQALPVLFVLTLRDDALEVGGLESLLVQQLERLASCYVHPIEPFGDEMATALIESMLKTDDALTSEIIQRAHGIPLFAVQLLGELVRGHKLELGEQGFALVNGEQLFLPDDIHELWQQRVDRCVMRYHGADQELLELASALGQDFAFEEWFDLAQILGKTIDLDFVEGLEVDGLLIFEQDRVSFAHSLLRESLERHAREQMRWESYHDVIVRYLDSRRYLERTNSGDVARLAEHMILANQFEQALPVLRQAMRQTLLQGHVERAQKLLTRYEQVIERCGEERSSTIHHRIESRLLQGILHNLQGDSSKAHACASQVMQDAHLEGLTELWSEAALMLAITSLQLGDMEQAELLMEVLERRLAMLERSSMQHKVLQAWYHMSRARQFQYHGQLDASEEAFKLLLQCLPELDFPGALMSICFNGLGDIYRSRGQHDRATQFTREALAFATRHDNPMLMADCYNDLSELERQTGDMSAARQHVNKAIALYESMGADQSLRAHRNLGYLALAERLFDEAYTIFQAIFEHLQHSQEQLQLTFALAGLLPCLIHREEFDRVLPTFDRFELLVEQNGLRHADLIFALELTMTLLDQAAVCANAVPPTRALLLQDTLRPGLTRLLGQLGTSVPHDEEA